MENFSFENLTVYKEARKLVVQVYRIINILPSNENFAICAQLRRAIVSVPSNIAEGSGRMSYKEKIHFLEIAYGSLMETYCQLEICCDLGYIQSEMLVAIKPQFFTVSRLINGLKKNFVEKLTL